MGSVGSVSFVNLSLLSPCTEIAEDVRYRSDSGDISDNGDKSDKTGPAAVSGGDKNLRTTAAGWNGSS